MSRTSRTPAKYHGFTSERDGRRTRPSLSCENNGDCPYCQNSRKRKNERRKPLEEPWNTQQHN